MDAKLRKTVLLVEDDVFIARSTATILKIEGYAVVVAYSGAEALFQFSTAKPDILLLDVMLPDMSGFEVLQELTDKGMASECIVLFLTAMGQTKDIYRGLGLGADGYITKPFNPIDLLRTIADKLARKRMEINDAKEDIIG